MNQGGVWAQDQFCFHECDWKTETEEYIVGREAQASLVPRPSPAPVFDRLQYAKTVFAYCKRSKTGAGEGLGMRLGSGHQVTGFCILQAIKYWSRGRPGNEARLRPTK